MPEDAEVDNWRGIEIPRELKGGWDISDWLSRDDELLEALLKVELYKLRLMQGGEEVPEIPKPLKQLKQLNGLPIKPASFEQVETEGTVTVTPGEREEIVGWKPFPAGIVWEVGVSDQDYTDYRYLVDEDYIFREAQREPLGIFNSPYRFPNPILVEDSMVVEVTRDSDAGSNADYVGKIRGIPIPQNLHDQLKQVWEV